MYLWALLDLLTDGLLASIEYVDDGAQGHTSYSKAMVLIEWAQKERLLSPLSSSLPPSFGRAMSYCTKQCDSGD